MCPQRVESLTPYLHPRIAALLARPEASSAAAVSVPMRHLARYQRRSKSLLHWGEGAPCRSGGRTARPAQLSDTEIRRLCAAAKEVFPRPDQSRRAQRTHQSLR
jgi:hypothetical protein